MDHQMQLNISFQYLKFYFLMHNKLKNVQNQLVKICFIFFNSFLIRCHPQIIASLFAIAIFFVYLIILM